LSTTTKLAQHLQGRLLGAVDARGLLLLDLLLLDLLLLGKRLLTLPVGELLLLRLLLELLLSLRSNALALRQ
jgi:hypothetical protein